MTATSKEPAHFGVTLLPDGAIFRVWAPERRAIHLAFVDTQGRERRRVRLHWDADGYFSAHIEDVKHGDLYFYLVDDDPKLYPDPAAHFQPQGVHGPSQVIDHDRFPWTDDDWPGAELAGGCPWSS